MSDTITLELACPECGSMFLTIVPSVVEQGDFVEVECPACSEKFHYD
jgi:DNA-directed RNA polymerase subunit RPC12/RpoP